MTADRWWVRVAARWLARIDGVSSQLRLAMLGLTGVSTATISLQEYGHGEFAIPLIAIGGVVIVVYTYLFTEGGVWNQTKRDSRDLSTNYAGPAMRIDDELMARAILAALRGRELEPDEREAIQAELDDAWSDYRDGIDIEAHDD